MKCEMTIQTEVASQNHGCISDLGPHRKVTWIRFEKIGFAVQTVIRNRIRVHFCLQYFVEGAGLGRRCCVSVCDPMPNLNSGFIFFKSSNSQLAAIVSLQLNIIGWCQNFICDDQWEVELCLTLGWLLFSTGRCWTRVSGVPLLLNHLLQPDRTHKSPQTGSWRLWVECGRRGCRFWSRIVGGRL